MAFASIAGRAGFVLELDKSQLDRGLPQAEQQFKRSFDNMERTAQRSGVSSARNFDDLLGSVRNMRGEADQLSRRLDTVGTGLDAAGASAGRFGAGLGGVVAKAGLAGFVISSLYQGSQRAQEALKTTGDEAFKTEGRLRNMASALMGGDIVGAGQALFRERKTIEDFGDVAKLSAEQLAALRDVHLGTSEAAKELADSQEKTTKATEGGVVVYGRAAAAAQQSTAANLRYADAVKTAGTANKDLAGAVLEANKEAQKQAQLFRDMITLGTRLADAQGNVIVRGGFAGLRPAPAPLAPGASILGPGAVPDTSGGAVPRSTPQRLQDALAAAQRADDLPEQLRIARQVAEFWRRRRDNVLPEHRKVWEKFNDDYQAALATVGSIEDQAAARRKSARDAANQRRKDAADKEARDYREGLKTREQNLRNAYDAALLTKNKSDDRPALRALKQFLIGEGRDPKLTSGERATYRGDVVALDKQRQGLFDTVADDDATRKKDANRLEEQLAANQLARAELSEKNTKDDLAALRRQLRNYQRWAKDRTDIYTAMEQAVFQGRAIETQKQINDLLGKGGTDSSSSFTLGDLRRMQFDFLQRLHGITNQFGNNITADGSQTATNTWQTAKLTERLVGSVDRLTSGVAHPGAKYARNLMMEAYGAEGSV